MSKEKNRMNKYNEKYKCLNEYMNYQEHAKAAFLLHFRKDCKTIAQVEFLPTTLAKIDQVSSVCGWLGCVLAGNQHTSTRGVDQYPFPDGDLSRMFQEASGSWPH